MPGWVVPVFATFVVSTVSACVFLWLRCRGIGRAFGPRAKWWAVVIVVGTAVVSTAVSVAAIAAGHHVNAAFVGLVLPGVLWLGEPFSQRLQRGSLIPRGLAAYFTLPLRRHNDRMGEDLSDWCDVRVRVVWQNPQRILDATRYYYNQAAGRLKSVQAQEELDSRRDSIIHKIKIVQMIDRGSDPDKVRDALQSHPATQNTRKYSIDYLGHLARRLEHEAGSELALLLAHLYRLGYRKLLIYPSRMPPRT